MKTILLITLLTTSQFAHALSASELDCMARNVYHETRGLRKNDWLRVARVLLARKETFSRKHSYHAKSNNLCDLARSSEYTSRLAGPIKERKVFREIQQAVKAVHNGGKELFFTTKRGKMIYR